MGIFNKIFDAVKSSPSPAYDFDDSDFDEDDEDDEFGTPPVCIACGGPYPDCQDSCKIFDD